MISLPAMQPSPSNRTALSAMLQQQTAEVKKFQQLRCRRRRQIIIVASSL
jgi:hypothetical protein